MKYFAYFPTLVGRDERPDLVDSALDTVKIHLNQNSNCGLIQTRNLVSEPGLQVIYDYLLLSSINFLKDQGYTVQKYEFFLSGLWAQKLNKDTYTNIHPHKNSQVCGWLFLEAPHGGSYPIFYDTRVNKPMLELDFVQGDEVTNATNSIHFNNVRPGTVLFNNSWMQHQLSMNYSESPTTCIHFITSFRDLVGASSCER